MKKKLLLLVLFMVLLLTVGCNDSKDDLETNNNDVVLDDENKDDTNEEITGDEDSSEESTEGEEEPPVDDYFNDEGETEEEPEGVFSYIYTFKKMDAIMYAKADVNIRTAPSTEGEAIGKFKANETIHVIGVCIENGWYKVEHNDGIGYVHYDYLVEAKVTVANDRYQWVASLDVASQTDQIIVVAATGTDATVSMYKRGSNGIWKEVFYTTEGKIGCSGLGKEKEGDGKTPVGVFHFIKAFGTKENPGTSLEYTVVDESNYWVDDPNSQYYNQFVSTNEVTMDWESAEHLTEYEEWYYYCLALDYNIERESGKGSAIFLHCTKTGPTAGCIAIPEQYMIEVLKNINDKCVIIIDTPEGVKNY